MTRNGARSLCDSWASCTTTFQLPLVIRLHMPIKRNNDSTPCPHKKVPLIFYNNFYKHARIFMIFGIQLCKWILIILVNLLRCVPCTSITWWRNVDVTEIMPFTVHVTLSPCCRETPRVYPSRDVATQFARFEFSGLQHLGYPSRQDLPFVDPWCERVVRTSAEGVEAAGPHHHHGSDCSME